MVVYQTWRIHIFPIMAKQLYKWDYFLRQPYPDSVVPVEGVNLKRAMLFSSVIFGSNPLALSQHISNLS
jgi:hypothetical protein